MVKSYSLKKDKGVRVAPNFRVEEFACKDGSDEILIDFELVALLQRIRDHFGKSVKVNSGYRTKEHNAKVGGSATSYHLKGQAADIIVSGVDPLTVGLYAAELLGEKGGIEIGDGYCHIDVRPTRWRAFTRSGGSSYTTVSDFGLKLKRNF